MKKSKTKSNKQIYEESRKDPRQMSIFGPAHARELQELYASGKKKAA